MTAQCKDVFENRPTFTEKRLTGPSPGRSKEQNTHSIHAPKELVINPNTLNTVLLWSLYIETCLFLTDAGSQAKLILKRHVSHKHRVGTHLPYFSTLSEPRILIQSHFIPYIFCLCKIVLSFGSSANPRP